jgi:hypothetical protein
MDERKHLTAAEVEKLLAAIKGTRNETRDRCLLLLMFRRGLRVSEACGLRLSQVNNELPRSKLRGIKPPLAYSHGPASLAGWMRVSLVDGLEASLRTTPTRRLDAAVASSLGHCLAASHPGACLLHARDGLRYGCQSLGTKTRPPQTLLDGRHAVQALTSREAFAALAPRSRARARP